MHNAVTANYLTVAENLSPRHGFLGIYSFTLDDRGDLAYWPYNRFPIGGYVLLKLAMSPFGDDFSSEIHAARTLMLVFFALGAVSAYLSLCRIVVSRWVALAATSMAFSSYYLLYYNDMVATENMPSLFGVLLTFHGMVVFVQEGRFRQLLVKACAALLLGWHVYALLLAFIVLGLARELVRALPLFRDSGGRISRAREGGVIAPEAAPSPGRYLALGAVALLFGTALLSFNLGNEYFALGGRVPLAELPTVDSMIRRFGLEYERNPIHAEALAWPHYLEGQFRRIGGMTIPYGWIEPIWSFVVKKPHWVELLPGMFTWGVVASGVCLLGLPFVRHGMLLAALALSGLFWTLPMRNNVFIHEYEAVFYVGIPLTVFTLVFLCIRRLISARFVPVLVAATLPAFALSSVEMAGVGIRGLAAAAEADLRRDFEVIRDLSGEGVLYIPSTPQRLPQYFRSKMRYFLAGSVILLPGQRRQSELADFVLLHYREEGPALLTPNNRRMFLYDRVLWDASYEYPTGSPIIVSGGTSRWNVYLEDGRLIYISEGCPHMNARFFLSVTPREANEPPEPEKRRGFDTSYFHLVDIARRIGRKCAGEIDLPDHELASIRTGQLRARDRKPIWKGEHRFER